jgi:hypothetical protein
MRRHCNRLASGMGALLAINLGALPATAATFEREITPSAQVVSANWLEQIISVLEFLHGVLRGDLPKLRQEPTLSGKLAIVAGHYAAHGLPNDLSASEKQGLINAVDALYSMLTVPAPDGPNPRPDTFLEVLKIMWADLGMPPEELG